MINEKDFRTVMFILIASFTIPLIIVNEAARITGYDSKLSQYLSYTLSIICFISMLKKPWIPRILGTFIGGKYHGFSQRISDNPNEQKEINEITIIQSLVSVKLSGVSYDLDKNQNAMYDGHLISGENKSYRFYVRIKTTHNERAGFIDLNFNNKPVTGFATSIEVNGTTKWRIQLEKNHA